MAIEITDVTENQQSVSASSPSEELSEERTETLQQQSPPSASVGAPRPRGRPWGSKDRQPRMRQARDASPDDVLEEEEPPPAPRPLTRRSTVRPQHSAPRRRVQIVEESDDEEEEEEEEEETPPPSPRTRRHQEWTAYRQQQATAHQTNVHHYASLFDRMLA